MGVRVRLFAALRESAGVGEVELDAGPLAALLDELRDRYGERFAALLAVSSVLLDGTATPRDAGTAVADGAELALLPPVSGGAADRPSSPRVPSAGGGPSVVRSAAPPQPGVLTAALVAASPEV